MGSVDSGLARGAAGVLMALALAACGSTTTVVRPRTSLESAGPRPRIVVMRPDIQVAVMTVGGLTLQRADWSGEARASLRAAAAAEAERRGLDLVFADGAAPPSPAEVTYERLHAAVGTTIEESVSGRRVIPSKAGRLDWSLGPGVAELGRQYAADYALFLVYRANRSSTTRRVFAAASLGLIPALYLSPAGESGCLSLVDLRTGDVVWFTRVASLLADVRDRDGADAAMARLFRKFPEP